MNETAGTPPGVLLRFGMPFELRLRRVPSTSRTRSAPWKPINHRFHNACYYKTYRLLQGRGRSDARAIRRTQKKVRNLGVLINGHKLYSKDSIKIIGLLRRLKRDANSNDITEASLYLAVPYMLREEQQTAFEVAQDDGNSRRNVVDWVTGCDRLWRTYATKANIAEVVLDLKRARQSSEEDETKYSPRLRNVVKRCRTVHTEYEVGTDFFPKPRAHGGPASFPGENSKVEHRVRRAGEEANL